MISCLAALYAIGSLSIFVLFIRSTQSNNYDVLQACMQRGAPAAWCGRTCAASYLDIQQIHLNYVQQVQLLAMNISDRAHLRGLLPAAAGHVL